MMILLRIIVYVFQLVEVTLGREQSIVWTSETYLADKITEPLGRLKVAWETTAEQSLQKWPNGPGDVQRRACSIPVKIEQSGVVLQINGLSLRFDVEFSNQRGISALG